MLDSFSETVMMLFAVGVAADVIESTRHANNIKEGTIVYYSAESALEMGLLVNKLLTDKGEAIGADIVKEGFIIPGLNGPDGSSLLLNFKVQGSATTNLYEDKVNGKYIIPLPWTGDVPWTGPGSIEGVGGCDFQKPPVRTGEEEDKIFHFTYKNSEGNLQSEVSAGEREHPCNWNKLKVGEKATIPLYYLNEGSKHNFTSFTLRMRTPCAYGNEMCPVDGNHRMELNCFDKGDSNIICKDIYDPIKQKKYGEVLVTWQIDVKDNEGNLLSLMPNEKKGQMGLPYDKDADSQLFEGYLNRIKSAGGSENYIVLNEEKLGKLIRVENSITIANFLSSSDPDKHVTEPVLKISVVGDLIGCKGETDCNYQNDSPESGTYGGIKRIPYIEYQVEFGTQHSPLSPSNIITAEGQYGQFTQTIQVKAPHTDTGLEYVIQQ